MFKSSLDGLGPQMSSLPSRVAQVIQPVSAEELMAASAAGRPELKGAGVSVSSLARANHKHDANSGNQISHNDLLDAGTTNHTALDAHVKSVSNPHRTTLPLAGLDASLPGNAGAVPRVATVTRNSADILGLEATGVTVEDDGSVGIPEGANFKIGGSSNFYGHDIYEGDSKKTRRPNLIFDPSSFTVADNEETSGTVVSMSRGHYSALFTIDDLVDGILTVTHNLNCEGPLAVIVADNEEQLVIPASVRYINNNQLTADFGPAVTAGAFQGVWRIRIVSKGAAFEQSAEITTDVETFEITNVWALKTVV